MAKRGSSNIFGVSSLADAYALKSIAESFFGSDNRIFGQKRIYGTEDINKSEHRRRSASTKLQSRNLQRIFAIVEDDIKTINNIGKITDKNLEKIAKQVGIAEGGLTKKDFYKRKFGKFFRQTSFLDSLGTKTKDLDTAQKAINEGINQVAQRFGQQGYDLTGGFDEDLRETSKDLGYRKALGLDRLNKSQADQDALYDKFVSEVTKGGTISFQEATSDANITDFHKALQNTLGVEFNALFGTQGGTDILNDISEGVIKKANESHLDALEDILDKIGGKSFLMDSGDVSKLENILEESMKHGVLSSVQQVDLENLIQTLNDREVDALNKIQDSLVKNGGLTHKNIDLILETLGMNKKITEKQKRKLQKDIVQLKKDIDEGKESSEGTLANTAVRGRIQRMWDFIADKNPLGALSIKGIIGFIGHQYQQHLSVVQDIAETQGRFSQTILNEFKTLRDDYNQMIRSEGAWVKDRVATSAQLLSIQYDLYDKLGRDLGKMDVSNLERIVNMERVIGMSSEEIAGTLEVLKNINRQGAEKNLDLIERYATIANTAGISTKTLFADITENSGLYALNVGRASDRLLQLNVQLIRAGLNMKTITDALNGFDTVEGTLEKTVKLSMLAGTQLDMMPIFMAKMYGDIPEATRLLTQQLRSISDDFWNSYESAPMRQFFSQEFGLSIDQLNKLRKGLDAVEKNQLAVAEAFAATTDKFYDNLRRMGWHRVLEAVQIHLLIPINSMFENSSGVFEGFIDVVTWGIRHLGKALRAVGGMIVKLKPLFRSVGDFFDRMEGFAPKTDRHGNYVMPEQADKAGSGLGSLLLVSTGLAVGFKALRSVFGLGSDKQVKLLTQIRNILMGQSAGGGWLSKLFGKGKVPTPATTGGVVMGGKTLGPPVSSTIPAVSPTAMGMGKILGLGAAGIGLSSYSAYQTGADWKEYLGGAISGGIAGLKAGKNPWAGLVGAVVGLASVAIAGEEGILSTKINDIRTKNPNISEKDARTQALEGRLEELRDVPTSTDREIIPMMTTTMKLWWHKLKHAYIEGSADRTSRLSQREKERQDMILGVRKSESDIKSPSTAPLSQSFRGSTQYRGTQPSTQSPSTTVNVPNTMKLDDETVNKIAQAMAKIQFGVNVNVDKRGNAVVTKEEMSIRHTRNIPSSLQENLG